jgi:hypothetical protein
MTKVFSEIRSLTTTVVAAVISWLLAGTIVTSIRNMLVEFPEVQVPEMASLKKDIAIAKNIHKVLTQ